MVEKYICEICGYIYNPGEGDPTFGIAAGTCFTKLPENWVCPECGVEKEEFVPEF